MSGRGEDYAHPGDVSITGLYTAAAYAAAGLPDAELFDLDEARRVYGATNAALALRRLFAPGAPDLPASLVQRQLMIDQLLRSGDQRLVLELASGLSRRGATFTADPAWRYLELDLPVMVARKRQCLARSAAGQAVAARDNWRLHSGNVATAPFADLLNALPGGGAVAVVAEGLLMYLDAAAQRRLWRRVAALLGERGGRFVFDLVPWPEQPAPGRSGAVLRSLMRGLTGGADFVRDQRSREDLIGELGEAGFTSVEVLEPDDLDPQRQLPGRDAATQVVLFCCEVARS